MHVVPDPTRKRGEFGSLDIRTPQPVEIPIDPDRQTILCRLGLDRPYPPLTAERVPHVAPDVVLHLYQGIEHLSTGLVERLAEPRRLHPFQSMLKHVPRTRRPAPDVPHARVQRCSTLFWVVRRTVQDVGVVKHRFTGCLSVNISGDRDTVGDLTLEHESNGAGHGERLRGRLQRRRVCALSVRSRYLV